MKTRNLFVDLTLSGIEDHQELSENITRDRGGRKCLECGKTLSLYSGDKCFEHSERILPAQTELEFMDHTADLGTPRKTVRTRKNHFVKSNNKSKLPVQENLLFDEVATGNPEIDELAMAVAKKFRLKNPGMILAGYRGDRETAKQVADVKGIVVHTLIKEGHEPKQIMELLNIAHQGSVSTLNKRGEKLLKIG